MSPARSARTASKPVTFGTLRWLTLCLALTLAPELSTLPPWITLIVAAVAILRLVLAARGRDAPSAVIRYFIAAAAIALLFLHFRTFNGLTAGGALLSLIAGLKLLETRTHRDVHALTVILYFLCLSALLQAEALWLLGYFVGVCWLITATLLRLPNIGSSLRRSGRLLVQALPIAAVLWLFFPRFGGPLWQVPDTGSLAGSGLSETMSPGDISDLALSDDVAFRVRFAAGSPVPAAAERYWRGPVLHEFDGGTWRRGDGGITGTPRPEFQGPAYRYTLSLEPTAHHWIFALDWPATWDLPRVQLTGDYMLVDPHPGAQPLDVAATSYTHLRAPQPLGSVQRRRDLMLPLDSNPRSLALARELRTAHPEEADYVDAVLTLFRRQPFYYTLHPPRLPTDSVDAFLFETRRGFCGHYASAFAALMRAGGLPARVVTGYQGGTYNRFADYWIVRQSDAHAWDEVWLDGRGWVRVDPTATIPPERVEHGLNDLVEAGALTSRWEQRTSWFPGWRLRFDALRLLWRERILEYDQHSQERLLGWLHVPEPDGRKVALVLAGGLILGMAVLTLQVRRELAAVPRDPLQRAYARLCRRLAAVGLPRRPTEGAEAFAARIAVQRPDLAASVGALCRRYAQLRYGTPGSRSSAAIASFAAAVRKFRPRGSRASS